MSWDIIEDKEREVLGFFCDTDDVLVGPLIYTGDGHPCCGLNKDEINEYMKEHNYEFDPRTMTNSEIHELTNNIIKTRSK